MLGVTWRQRPRTIGARIRKPRADSHCKIENKLKRFAKGVQRHRSRSRNCLTTWHFAPSTKKTATRHKRNATLVSPCRPSLAQTVYAELAPSYSSCGHKLNLIYGLRKARPNPKSKYGSIIIAGVIVRFLRCGHGGKCSKRARQYNIPHALGMRPLAYLAT